MKFRSVSFRYNYRDDDACNIFYSCINLAHVKSDDENYRTLWIMTTKMHSTAKILKFATLPLISAIFIDIYFFPVSSFRVKMFYVLCFRHKTIQLRVKVKYEIKNTSKHNDVLYFRFRFKLIIKNK